MTETTDADDKARKRALARERKRRQCEREDRGLRILRITVPEHEIVTTLLNRGFITEIDAMSWQAVEAAAARLLLSSSRVPFAPRRLG